MGPRADENLRGHGAVASEAGGPHDDAPGRSPNVPSRWRALGQVLRVLAVSLLVGWAALELQLRFLRVPGSAINVFKDFHRADARLGWTGRPDVALRFRERSFDVLIEQGEDGFRRPNPPPPAEAPRRVLFLGDSLLWGWGVEQGELVTDELQRRLGPGVAIENRAVSSYGTAQELLLLQDLLGRRHYDAVVLVFSRTDPEDNVDDMKLRPAFRLVDGRLEQVRWPPPEEADRPLSGFLRSTSLAFRFAEAQWGELRRWIDGKRGRQPADRRSVAPEETDFRNLPGYDLTRELLHEMQRLVAAHGASFVVAYQPHHVFPMGSPEAAARAARDLVADLCSSLGIPLVDVGGAFVGHRDDLVIPNDGHWTSAGHLAVAAALLDSPDFRAAIAGSPPTATARTSAAASLAGAPPP